MTAPSTIPSATLPRTSTSLLPLIKLLDINSYTKKLSKPAQSAAIPSTKMTSLYPHAKLLQLKVTPEPLTSATVLRTVEKVVTPMDTSDGAGVNLKRSIGSPKLPDLDPFLLLDEFKSDDPKDYEAGFPEHPHRGFETVTIMLQGNFKHQDSKGNTGFLTSGGVQWMTAGKGLQHSETPMQSEGLMWGYQLWVNLPKKDKMQNPRYQDLQVTDIPNLEFPNGTIVRLIAGQIGQVKGPVSGVTINPTLLDVYLPAGETFQHTVPDGHTLFVYTSDGEVSVDGTKYPTSRIVVFNPEGTGFKVAASNEKASRFLVVSGAPIKEPIARYGPFVMNTKEEILQTLKDFQTGNF